jgi:hypothetical protein
MKHKFQVLKIKDFEFQNRVIHHDKKKHQKTTTKSENNIDDDNDDDDERRRRRGVIRFALRLDGSTGKSLRKNAPHNSHEEK